MMALITSGLPLIRLRQREWIGLDPSAAGASTDIR